MAPITRRELIAGAGALALLTRVPVGMALGPSVSTTPAFVDALLARMTVEEKVGQLTLFTSAVQDPAAAAANPVAVRPTPRASWPPRASGA